MKNFDKLFFGLLFGGTFPFLFCLLALVTWFYLDKTENDIFIYLGTGLFLGISVDLLFLKKWIQKRYDLPVWFLIGMHGLYNIGVFGFFMGFPVFNLLLGLIAGYYWGKRIRCKNIENDYRSRTINRVSLFTGFIMTIICMASGCIGLAGNGVGYDIQNMLGLNFAITRSMLWGITLLGGFSLILIQVVLTRFVLIKTIKSPQIHI